MSYPNACKENTRYVSIKMRCNRKVYPSTYHHHYLALYERSSQDYMMREEGRKGGGRETGIEREKERKRAC